MMFMWKKYVVCSCLFQVFVDLKSGKENEAWYMSFFVWWHFIYLLHFFNFVLHLTHTTHTLPWQDVVSLPQNGLFDEIARGLLECKVVVACVSDDYVDSPSCCKEFRYACTVLNLPVVICVVGTGHKWRRSEVGHRHAFDLVLTLFIPY